MASRGGISYKTKEGVSGLLMIDEFDSGDERVANAIKQYADHMNGDRTSTHWARSVRYIENIFFVNGRQYVNDVLISRLANTSDSGVGDISVVREVSNNIPKPTNDMLGRYIETNVSLYTENNPRPRITPKSDRDEDQTAAELSELTLEYLWEALKMPEKHREIARMMLCCGIAFMEIAWDPTVPRRVQIPKTELNNTVDFTQGAIPQTILAERQVPVIDPKTKLPVMEEDVVYGDLVANVLSPFQMHFPDVHYWNSPDHNWIMKEEYAPIVSLQDRYLKIPKEKSGLTKANGWNLEVLTEVQNDKITDLAMWWWERLSSLVEGPGPSLYIGSPDAWDGYAIVRTFDRAPCQKWPQGRTVIMVGDQVLYDSPKKIGARAYDKRWPSRWHPYIRFRWEAQIGSIYGRSMIAKLLPYVKRINSIDTTLIMYRRTVPIATWIAPKGTQVTEDMWTGQPGNMVEYDPRRTANARPEVVYPPPYPNAILEEKQECYMRMEEIAGTEQILRGERPVGVNSASMVDILRKQALASRSPSLQDWDEQLQDEGSLILQTVIRNVKDDARYAEGIRLIAREKHSRVAIEAFSGEDLSDNVIVRVDTASLALASKEAREAKVIEILQYLPNIMTIQDIGLRQAILDELGLKKSLMPSGPDVNRAKKMLSLVKQNRADRIVVLQEDDPFIFYTLFVNEMKGDGFVDLPADQQQTIIGLINIYKRQIELRQLAEQQQMEAQMMLQAQMGIKPGQGGQGQGA